MLQTGQAKIFCTKKDWVNLSFSKFAKQYDEKADWQRPVAEKLCGNIISIKDQVPNAPILEIGCGTGFVTLGLLGFFNKYHFEITDISKEMLEFCRNKIEAKDLSSSKHEFYLLDGENISKKNHYSLIFSGLTVQWFHDFENSMKSLIEALKPGGIFCFSVLGDSCFREWRDICSKANVPFTRNKLPTTKTLEAFEGYDGSSISYEEEYFTMRYPSPKDFFISLKSVGAGTKLKKAKKSENERENMKKLIEFWTKQNPKETEITFHVIYGTIRKKPTF